MAQAGRAGRVRWAAVQAAGATGTVGVKATARVVMMVGRVVAEAMGWAAKVGAVAAGPVQQVATGGAATMGAEKAGAATVAA